MDNIGKCIYLNNFPFINTSGQLRFCCKNSQPENEFEMNIKTHTLKEMYATFAPYRSLMASGQELPGCNVCYDQEQVNQISFRQRVGANITNSEPNIINALDLRVGNTCNLQCVMCSLTDSNSWYKIYPQYAKYVKKDSEKSIQKSMDNYNPKKLNWAEYESSWENIFCSITDKVEHAYIAGGEPFYIPNFQHYLQELMQRCPDAKVSINTNATRLLNDAYISNLKKYSIDTRISMDGIGEVDEYVRQGTNWQEKMEVIQQYSSVFSKITFDITLSALNILKLPDTINWIKQNYPDKHIFLRPVVNQEHLSIRMVPLKERLKVLEYLRSTPEQFSNKDQIEHILQLPEIVETEVVQKLERTITFFDMNSGLSYKNLV